MPAPDIDSITIAYEEDGVPLVKELEKEVLTRGSWTTIVFKYQDWSKAEEKWGPEKASIRRYQKTSGEYRQRSKFNISNAAQAHQVAAILVKWFKA